MTEGTEGKTEQTTLHTLRPIEGIGLVEETPVGHNWEAHLRLTEASCSVSSLNAIKPF